MNTSKRVMRGQAMVEAVIVMALVLLPLFLVMPLLGKYADVNLTVVEGARYVAWERSVWHDEDGEFQDGVDRSTVPRKSSRQIQNEVGDRFFGDSDRQIQSANGIRLDQGELQTFYHDAQGEPIILVNSIDAVVGSSDPTPGIGYDIMRGFTGFLNLIYTPLSWLGGEANFSPNLDGYYQQADAVSVELEQPNDYFREMLYRNERDGIEDLSSVTLNFSADSSLIVDSWSAQGAQHFQNQTGGLVPTSMLNFPLLNTLRDVAATVLLEPKLKQPDPGEDDGLCMGCFNTEPFSLDDY